MLDRTRGVTCGRKACGPRGTSSQRITLLLPCLARFCYYRCWKSYKSSTKKIIMRDIIGIGGY